MKRYGFYAGLIILIAVNAFVLAGVRYNRSGSPDAAVELTERELPLNYADEENSGMSFHLDWRQYDGRELKWFDRGKLVSLGFDCRIPVDAGGAETRYRKALPRKTFVVLEFEGREWRNWQASEQKDLRETEAKVIKGKETREELDKAKKQFARELATASRLFPVDVGNDPKRLRVAYPDRRHFIITPAKVRLQYHSEVREKGKLVEPAVLSGMIEEVLTDTVQVPREMQSLLRSLKSEDGPRPAIFYLAGSNEKPIPPRYRVVLNYGRRYEPWVASVQR